MNEQGKFYKVEAEKLEDCKPKNFADMEKVCISVEGLAALTEIPVDQTAWDAAVQANRNAPKEEKAADAPEDLRT